MRKKLLLIQRNPFAGQPLLGGLIGYRKLSVGNRHSRIVWRVIEDGSSSPLVEIAEIWAIGARADSAVYQEIRRRIDRLGETPETLAIRSILDRLNQSKGATDEDATESDRSNRSDPVPPWLTARLQRQIGITSAQLETLSGEAAMKIWEDFITSKPNPTPPS